MSECKEKNWQSPTLKQRALGIMALSSIPLSIAEISDASGLTYPQVRNIIVKLGSEVELSVKPTHVAIGKEFHGDISFSNQLPAKIIEIDNGTLLSSVKLASSDALFESIISLERSQKMDLKVGESVTLFLKASDLYIKKVL